MRLPNALTGVMSVLAPPGAKREPFAKSLPASSEATNLGISAGSLEASASIITMMSPDAAANPQARALPLPRPSCRTTRTSGRIVPSLECPSTRITSSTIAGIRASTCGRFAASSSVGITTLIEASEEGSLSRYLLPAMEITAAIPAVESLTLIRCYLRGHAALVDFSADARTPLMPSAATDSGACAGRASSSCTAM